MNILRSMFKRRTALVRFTAPSPWFPFGGVIYSSCIIIGGVDGLAQSMYQIKPEYASPVLD